VVNTALQLGFGLRMRLNVHTSVALYLVTQVAVLRGRVLLHLNSDSAMYRSLAHCDEDGPIGHCSCMRHGITRDHGNCI